MRLSKLNYCKLFSLRGREIFTHPCKARLGSLQLIWGFLVETGPIFFSLAFLSFLLKAGFLDGKVFHVLP